ncbi:MAG: hypothetical protein K5906_03085 [Bacilli bacterium]|nr:hypothetical protein [Bacilli bacterium]
MKTTNKITMVSLGGALALVGTAFAAWQFNASVNKVSASNVEITKNTSTGTIDDVATFYLTLDQSGAYWTNRSFDASEETITEADKITNFAFVYTGSDTSSDVSDVTLTVTYVVDAGIEEYVNVSEGELVNVTANNNKKSGTYNLPTLSYTANKPTTSASYEVMKEALAGKKVTFTLNAEVNA